MVDVILGNVLKFDIMAYACITENNIKPPLFFGNYFRNLGHFCFRANICDDIMCTVPQPVYGFL